LCRKRRFGFEFVLFLQVRTNVAASQTVATVFSNAETAEEALYQVRVALLFLILNMLLLIVDVSTVQRKKRTLVKLDDDNSSATPSAASTLLNTLTAPTTTSSTRSSTTTTATTTTTTGEIPWDRIDSALIEVSRFLCCSCIGGQRIYPACVSRALLSICRCG
jgi:hypothetical protein